MNPKVETPDIQQLESLLAQKLREEKRGPTVSLEALKPFMPEVSHIDYSSEQTWLPIPEQACMSDSVD